MISQLDKLISEQNTLNKYIGKYSIFVFKTKVDMKKCSLDIVLFVIEENDPYIIGKTINMKKKTAVIK